MAAVRQNVTVDTRELEREVIPALLAYGRRTLQEQCVTSATFIAFAWSKGIPFADIGQIDESLDEVVRVAKSGAVWTRGMIIAQQRTNPKSAYSISTGNRWPLAKPGGKRGGLENYQFYVEAAERMKKARHSSAHYIQSGCKPIIRQGMESPYYKYNAAFGSRRVAIEDDNPLNTLDSNQLGGMVIDVESSVIEVTGYNAVGENVGDSNDVLAKKHREAAIEYAVPALGIAVEKEKSAGYAELQRRVDLGWKMKYPEWA